MCNAELREADDAAGSNAAMMHVMLSSGRALADLAALRLDVTASDCYSVKSVATHDSANS